MNQNSEKNVASFAVQTVLPNDSGGFIPCPNLLTEEELIQFLRIPEISNAKDFHNVVENLKRMQGLPRVHICGKTLFPLDAVIKWLQDKVISEK